MSVASPLSNWTVNWIDAHQLGRRNLTPDQASLLRGRRYNRTKRQGERTDLTSGNSCHKLETTADILAEQHGVSPRTIRNDGQYAAAVKKLGIEAEVARGSLDAPRRDVVDFVEGDPRRRA